MGPTEYPHRNNNSLAVITSLLYRLKEGKKKKKTKTKKDSFLILLSFNLPPVFLFFFLCRE
jgi:hypothetical protein